MSKKPLADERREYGTRSVDTLHACPITQFSLWLKEAIASESVDPTAMVLSTVSEAGQPDARVVLLKDMTSSPLPLVGEEVSGSCSPLPLVGEEVSGSCSPLPLVGEEVSGSCSPLPLVGEGLGERVLEGFVFYTHSLSTKGKQLQAHPVCALTFYWPHFARQVRIQGQVHLLSAEEGKQYFESRPYLSQLSSLISPQSEVIPDRHWLESALKTAQEKYPEGQVPTPEDWQGYIVIPTAIEFWQGRDSRLHDRILYTKQPSTWGKVRLAP